MGNDMGSELTTYDQQGQSLAIMKRTFLNKATFKFLLGFNKESFQASSALLFDDEVTFGDPHVTIHLLLMRVKRVILEIQKILHN